MACKTSYELHHNFPKIADEAGFTFNANRPRIRIDWNKIRIIDTENLIRERKFTVIEQHLNDILDCILESEFDVRILDEGVLKMFRLAQLAVEYQQFCRHYLDRSVFVLREEINTLAQELDVTKKELKDRDEEIRKLKKKSKYNYRTPLPYGNDNIASMILKTLTNKSDFFPTSITGDANQYNKCSFCDKVFMNQLYLKSHISRRHSNVTEIPQKDSNDIQNKSINTNIESSKLHDEVSELKFKLRGMEDIIKNLYKQDNNTNVMNSDNKPIEEKNSDQQNFATVAKEMIDAEVSMDNDINLLDKIEEWKKAEQEKYNKEINLLKNEILETIQTLKEKEINTTNANTYNELKIIDQLNATINQQGSEIFTLKQELIDSKLRIEKEEAVRRSESDVQMMQLVNRAEAHAKQYESLLQKLNDVANEARESRAQAEAEKERVAQLESMLQKTLNEKSKPELISERRNISNHKSKDINKITPDKKKTHASTPLPEANLQTLEQLHLKAQALLNIKSSSSSSSDISSVERNTPLSRIKTRLKNKQINRTRTHKNTENNEEKIFTLKSKEPFIQEKHKNISQDHKIREYKNKEKSKSQTDQNSTKNGPIISGVNLGSPIKIVRAKIMEEVNNRLISAGVDPLNNGLAKMNYQKQWTQIQQQVELKVKRNSTYELAKHSLLAYLDSKLPKKVVISSQEYVSPNRTMKSFNLTSVISNVKSKALSLVKSNELNQKIKRQSLNADVAKRAMTLLNTPPDSTHSSPIIEKEKDIESQIGHMTELKRNTFTLKNTIKNPVPEKIISRSINSSPHSDHRNDNESDNSDKSDHKYYKAVIQQSSKSIEKLIKSPARRPLSANSEYNNTIRKYSIDDDDHLLRSQSVTNISHKESDANLEFKESAKNNENTTNSEYSENIPIIESLPKNNAINNVRQTKGVLKNASSISSLNKKKVLFDMDAIQMKSVSASPSLSITEKSDGNEKYELGLINLDGEEWDISSIENEPLHNDTKLRISTRTSPKIAELTQTIESQLAKRNETPSTAIVGGVDILAGPMLRVSSVGGSNTSLGSSILDDSENLAPVVNHRTFVKPKSIIHKDDSEIDLSEFSTDGMAPNKNDTDAF